MKTIYAKLALLSSNLITVFIPACLLSVLIYAHSATAQVAITLGVQEIYDDNIYLEDDSNSLPEILSNPLTRPEEITDEDIERLDGDPNSDFITASTLALSFAIPTGKFLKTGAQGTVGSLMFADKNSENRITLDSNVLIESTKELLGETMFFNLSSEFDSQSNTISVAEGSVARQAQSHTAQFQTGAKGWAVTDQISLDLFYTLMRYDFLKEFTLNDERNDSLIKAQGADYIKNALDFGIKKEFSDRLSGKITSGVEYLSFMDSGDANVVDGQEDIQIPAENLNRINYDLGTSLDYELSQLFKISTHVGLESSYFDNKNEDSSNGVITDDEDSNTSLAYGISASYTPDLKTVLSSGIEQASGTDSSGARVLARTASLNASRKLTDAISFLLGGRFMQFDNDDSLSKSTDRYELSTTLTFSLTESLVLSTGMNYAHQSKDDNAIGDILSSYASDEYESTRLFVAISGGLVGIKR